jgi:hypothetical protein
VPYRVIYDAREIVLSDWTFVAGLLFFAVIGLAVWAVGVLDERLCRGLDRPGQARLFRRWGLRIAAVFAGMAVITGLLEFSENAGVRRALERGDYTVVEGTVQGFEPGDRGGHRDEQFSVRSGGRIHTYRYRSSQGRPGFHQSHGPIREGLRVRIADVDGAIARLEIADEPARTGS